MRSLAARRPNLKAKPSDFCLKSYQPVGRYPKRWTKGAIQKAMLQWSDHRCEVCGARGEDELLHVHHLHWADKHDCRWENLLVCCVSCHTRIHNHKWQPGKPWSLTATPDWMTQRGYSNPADGTVKLCSHDHAALYLLLFLLGAITLRRSA